MEDQGGYPGASLGLPARGPGSMAPFGRRLLAILIDWALCQLIALSVFDVEVGTGGAASLAPLAIFSVENLLLVSTLGYTVGHRLLGLQVIPDTAYPVGRGPRPLVAPGPAPAAIRTALLALAVPALVWDSHGRGWHDRLAGTVIVRRIVR